MPTLSHSQSSLVSSDEENEERLGNDNGGKIESKRKSKSNDTGNESEDEQVGAEDNDESLKEGDESLGPEIFTVTATK